MDIEQFRSRAGRMFQRMSRRRSFPRAPQAESSPAPTSSMTRKLDGVGDDVQDDEKSRAHASGDSISHRNALDPTPKHSQKYGFRKFCSRSGPTLVANTVGLRGGESLDAEEAHHQKQPG